MTQAERRAYLIARLAAEEPRLRDLRAPEDERAQRRLLRGLMNARAPRPADADFLAAQDAYLREETARKGVTALSSLAPAEPGIYLWRGDITALACDAIVNAANSGMTGCYVPCHGCVDNCIHTYAGVQLRLACAELMEAQGYPEPPGRAKLTPAFNLPCKYVLHTVGPIVSGEATARDEALLASCYRACLERAAEGGLRSVAFCCISTGEFHFPNALAARIAVRTARETLRRLGGEMAVIFCVYKELDERIYKALLGGNRKA